MDVSADEVREWIDSGEGRRLEFKRGLPREERIARTLCAFANTKGGILLVGVTDARRVFGVPEPRTVMARLRSVAAEYVDPPVDVELQAVAIEGEQVVCCSVPLSPRRPHTVARGTERETVVRVGSSNRRAGAATLRAMARKPRSTSLDPLERKIINWLRQSQKRGESTAGATVAAFSKSHNVGTQRARRAFIQLEQDGLIVAHGRGGRREYGLA